MPSPNTRIEGSSLRYAVAACQTDLPNPKDRGGRHHAVGHMLGMIDRTVVREPPVATVRPVAVADTEIGKIGAAPCYDWLFPEAIRQLALGGAEVLVRVSAYMDPWGATPPMDWWTLINRCRALENLAYVLAANQGARAEHYPPFTWPRGSMVVDYDGRILCQADPGPGEKIVFAPIDVLALRAEP